MTGEMIPHITATQLAITFQRNTQRIRELILELGEQLDELQGAFNLTHQSGSYLKVELYIEGHNYKPDAKSADLAIKSLKRHAWRALIEKLDIRKVMSSKRQEELKEALYYNDRYGSKPKLELPEITEESILSVLSGMVSSAHEFLGEAIQEEFDWLRPRRSTYKTNRQDRVPKKVIVYAVERSYNGHFRPRCGYEGHIRAVDWIFHSLAGQGIPRQHDGPLMAAIEGSGKVGEGETEFFRFRCCKNGNLHLEFKRLDLLNEFNAIAGNPSRVGAGK